MNHFFTNQTTPAVTILEQNILNGKTAERHFAGLLASGLNARVSWTSRTEDDSKLDLVTIMSHPWAENKVEILFTQVKSGPSYARIDDEKFFVQGAKFADLLHSNHNSLICWTTVDAKTAYWFFIKANATYFRKEYNSSHLFSPLTRFDLMRILTAAHNKNGGKGLTFQQGNRRHEYGIAHVRVLRNRAKQKYWEIKQTPIYNPLFGKIELTRLGWRHITRESRYNVFKVASYEIMTILASVLRCAPTKHYIKNTGAILREGIVYRETEFILVYNEITVVDEERDLRLPVDVYIKLVEVASYREDWRATAEAATEIQRRVIFRSIYYKQKGRS